MASTANLYTHFHLLLGDSSYYPPGSPKLSDHRLFGMYHSKTPQHHKDVIINSLTELEGVVCVVFVLWLLNMDTDSLICNVSMREGRGVEPSTSTVYFSRSQESYLSQEG